MLQAEYIPYFLDFKEPGGTSRGVLTRKETFFVKIYDAETPQIFGLGECALFRGLSAEDNPSYTLKLKDVCRHINEISTLNLTEWSSIQFGVETALRDLQNGGNRVIFPSPFLQQKGSIEINGLIWMGDKTTMQKRIEQKLNEGYHCIKLKIGAIDFDAECQLLKEIRSRFSPDTIELRVDANGAFKHTEEALQKINRLAAYHLHSIEQPVKQNQWDMMKEVCAKSALPVALDEELIGIYDMTKKKEMVSYIRPQYIILKPSLIGGFSGADEWISIANEYQIGWWITSALESDIGLNAIAQWCYLKQSNMPQGLGTGQLYTNNIASPLSLSGSHLFYDSNKKWDLSSLSFMP